MGAHEHPTRAHRLYRVATVLALLAGGVAGVVQWMSWQHDQLAEHTWFAGRLALLIIVAASASGLTAGLSRGWLGIPSVVVVLTAFAVFFSLEPNDDAFVFFRYASNVLEGHGPVFNPGERVEGYSSPLWLAMLVPLAKLVGNSVLPTAAAVMSAACMAAAAAGIIPIARHLGATWSAASAAVIATSFFGSGFWGFSGMGTGLGLALSTWAVAVVIPGIGAPGMLTNGRCLATGILMAAANLARAENAILTAVIGVWLVASAGPARLRRVMWFASVPVLAIGSHLLFRRIFYGSWTPNTFTAKVGSLFENLQPGLDYLWNGLPAMAPVLALALAGLFHLTSRCRLRAFMATVVASQVVVIAATGADYFIEYRFLLPIWFAGWALAAPPLESAVMTFSPGGNRAARAAVVAALAASTVLSSTLYESRGPRSVLFFGARLVDRWSAFGTWAAHNTPPATTIATPVIGAIGFYSERPIVDMLGLTEPTIARTPRRDSDGMKGHSRSNVAYVLAREPDIIFLDGWWPGEQAFRDDTHLFPAIQDLADAMPHPRYQFATIRTGPGNVAWSVYIRRGPRGSS